MGRVSRQPTMFDEQAKQFFTDLILDLIWRRHTSGLTQKQLAEKLGVSAAYVGYVERGGPIGAEMLIKWGLALGVRMGAQEIKRFEDQGEP